MKTSGCATVRKYVRSWRVYKCVCEESTNKGSKNHVIIVRETHADIQDHVLYQLNIDMYEWLP
jgi:hypothetical protein